MLLVLSQASMTCQAAEPPRIGGPVSTAIAPAYKYILVERAEICSGPSEQYYPTSYAKKGESIEVHHRTGDGWLGIRPPQGSFSWLPATQGYLLPGGRTVEVTDDAAVSWIGSQLGTAKQYRWQVQLHPGEQLTILGEAKMVSEDNREALWYRIAPPAGEFRWIRVEATTDTPPASITKIADAVNKSVEQKQTVPEQSLASQAQTRRNEDQLPAVSNSGNVVQANYEEAAMPDGLAPTGRPRSKKVSPRRSSTSRSVEQDQWAGWHAMEYSAQGWTFPAFDRLLGKGPSSTGPHGPGAHVPSKSYDPYDLAQQSSDGGAGLVSTPESSEASARPWRDPEQLRQSRLAVLNESTSDYRTSAGQFGADFLPEDSSVELAVGSGAARSSPSENSQSNYPGVAGLIKSEPMALKKSEPMALIKSEPMALASGVEANDSENLDALYNKRLTQPHTHPLRDPRLAPSAHFSSSQIAEPTEYSPLGFSNLDLSQIHIALSQIVSQSMQNWTLAPLADRTRHLIEHGASAIERGEARLLLERIQSFQSLAQRSVGMFDGQDGITSDNTAASIPANGTPVQSAAAWQIVTPPLTSGPQPSDGATLPSRIPQPFDAIGWLVPVHASSLNQPTFALTDESGKTIVYLSPAPGLNLSRYVNQAVGVFGLRGYLPNLKTNHIEAQRIVRLR